MAEEKNDEEAGGEFNLNAFSVDLDNLNDTQESVEEMCEQFLSFCTNDLANQEILQKCVDCWILKLREKETTERIPFLYVANHLLQQADDDAKQKFKLLFEQYMEEAVSLVCNHPLDRESVTRLLQIWQELKIFSPKVILNMWVCTGEEIPESMKIFASTPENSEDMVNEGSDRASSNSSNNFSGNFDIPFGIHGQSSNPIVDILKKIDRHRQIVQFLDLKLANYDECVNPSTILDKYTSKDDIISDRSVSATQLRRKVEKTIQLSKIRHKYLAKLSEFEQSLSLRAEELIKKEEEANDKLEAKLELCDEVDILLADLDEHQQEYADEWEKQRLESIKRSQLKKERDRLQQEKMMRLQKEAVSIAENSLSQIEKKRQEMKKRKNTAHLVLPDTVAAAAHIDRHAGADSMEYDFEERERRRQEEEEEKRKKMDQQLVWHPVLKELVPLNSFNQDTENWRDKC